MTGYPLEGLKVVELARILAGPWAGQVLADLGATVVKVESPQGDDTRQWGPPFIDNPDGSSDAAYFHATNRGKRSVVADFGDAGDLQRVFDLIDEADIVIENFKVGGLEKFGLDYASLAQRNPRLIFCSITGFGQDGPYAPRPGYDFIVQGMSGMMHLTGQPDGEPQKIGVALADVMTGLYAVIAIQAALVDRERTGQGQSIDIALLDVMVGVLANQALNFLVSGTSPMRMGNAHPNIVPYEAFECADGWLIIAVGNDRQFSKLGDVLQLAHDPDFAGNAQRLEHRTRLQQLIHHAVSRWPRAALLAALEANGIPCGPINTVDQAFADDQVMHRQMRQDLRREDGLVIPGVRIPISFSRSRVGADRPSPLLERADEA